MERQSNQRPQLKRDRSRKMFEKLEVNQLDRDSRSSACPRPEDLLDYNVVRMSEFKDNPGKFLLQTNDVPVAISRYGHVAGILLTIKTFNDLLAKMRNQSALIRDLASMLEQYAPGVVELNAVVPARFLHRKDYPKWPLLGHEPRKERVARAAAWSSGEAEGFAEEAREYLEWMSGNWKLPDEDAEEDWGRGAVLRSDD